MTADEAGDYLEIQRLITAWTVAGDQGRVLDSVWTEDAVLYPPGGMRIVGRDNIVARFRGERYIYTTRDSDAAVATEMLPISSPPALAATRVRHHLTSMMIELQDAESATGLIYVVMLCETGLIGSGRYEDKYRKIGGRWYIAERKTRLEYLPPGEQWAQIRALAAADLEAERQGKAW